MKTPGDRLHLRDDVSGDEAGLTALRAAGCGDHEDQLLIALPELVAQQRNCPGRFRGRVLEAAGRQALGDGKAEYRGRNHHQNRHRENPPGRGDGEASDPLQHSVLPVVIPALTYQR